MPLFRANYNLNLLNSYSKMVTPLRIITPRCPIYTIVLTIACFCIWQAFGFIIVTKRETSSIATQILRKNLLHKASTENGVSVPADQSSTIPHIYCVDGDCTCKSMGCFKCSEKEEIPELVQFCESENFYQKFECERSNLIKYGKCQSENFTPFKSVEEVRFLKFEIFCLMLSILSTVVVWRRKKVGERVIVKRIQKLIEEPI